MEWEPFLRFAAAALFAGVIGLDRELRAKPAGLRTNIVVGVASAAFGWISVEAFPNVGGYDPSRVASQVVSGIGFLGGGAIFSAGGKPHGLTTAAALWGAAAAGLSAGLGLYVAGAAMVGVTILALWPLDLLSERMIQRRARRDAEFHLVVDDLDAARRVQDLVTTHGLRVVDIDIAPFGDLIRMRVVIHGPRRALSPFARELGGIDGLRFASEETLVMEGL